MASEERLRELEEKYENYTVYDNQGSKIGKVDDLFVDEKDHEEYIGVKLGFLGRKSTLIPTEVVRVNENDRTIEVAESKDHVKEAPSFDDDEDVTAEYEERIRRHFGLESLQSGSAGTYGSTTGASAGTAAAGSSDHDEEHSSASSGSGFGEDSSTAASGQGTPEGSSAAGGGYYDQSGGTGDSAERRETSGASAVSGSTGESSSGSQPSTTRQTEETETFQEGGRTKIRRRIIREEVVDADDGGPGS